MEATEALNEWYKERVLSLRGKLEGREPGSTVVTVLEGDNRTTIDMVEMAMAHLKSCCKTRENGKPNYLNNNNNICLGYAIYRLDHGFLLHLFSMKGDRYAVLSHEQEFNPTECTITISADVLDLIKKFFDDPTRYFSEKDIDELLMFIDENIL